MLSKHSGNCRFPHGHSRRIEIVVVSDALDVMDMVCDFKALKAALAPFLAAKMALGKFSLAPPRIRSVPLVTLTHPWLADQAEQLVYAPK
jgi:hypothetical protein